MKLGCSYNIFDGEELLKDSILSVRENVDYISVVYQVTSNHGNECSPDLLDKLIALQEEDLIDDLVFYEPDLNKHPHDNELRKRNIGLYHSRGKHCTHHLSMDADEFYEKDLFREAKQFIDENDIDSCACRLFTYYKNNFTILDPLENYYVSFIYRIRDGFDYNIIPFPVLVDPTRRMPPGNFHLFTQDRLIMHHFSYVRDDIKKKMLNSSARQNTTDGAIAKVVFHYKTWQRGMDAYLHPASVRGTKEIKPKFLTSWSF